jgi:ketosteroid isomerase-like protein
LEENIEFVQTLWRTLDQHGLEAALELTDPDVSWDLHRADRVSTTSELLAFLNSFEGERQAVEATVYSVEAHGHLVIASGSLRLSDSQGLLEFQIHIIYEFSNGRLVRAKSYPSRVEAEEALEAQKVE